MAIPDVPTLELAGEEAERKGATPADLIRRALEGDAEAFEEILRRHDRRILGMAVQMGLSPPDAQDVCQEVFLRVFRYLRRFRAGENFEVWVWRIAVNVVYDTLRRRKNRAEVTWDGEFLPPAGEGGVRRVGGLEIRLQNADLCNKLLGRLGRLSPRERMVFVLKDLQELETADVARALGITGITVRRHLAAARQRLREILEELEAPG
jgi:RNA polymerase sigma-70 factor (ECF subfamily)